LSFLSDIKLKKQKRNKPKILQQSRQTKNQKIKIMKKLTAKQAQAIHGSFYLNPNRFDRKNGSIGDVTTGKK